MRVDMVVRVWISVEKVDQIWYPHPLGLIYGVQLVELVVDDKFELLLHALGVLVQGDLHLTFDG